MLLDILVYLFAVIGFLTTAVVMYFNLKPDAPTMSSVFSPNHKLKLIEDKPKRKKK